MSVSEIVQRLELLEEHCKIEATKVARLWGMHEGVLALQMPHVVPNGPALRPGESTGVRSEAEPWKTYNPLPASLDSEPIPVATPAAIERETPKPPKASGLRTERVTLEITHKDDGLPIADWPWRCILTGKVVVCRSVAESVRVVDDDALDAGAERLREERDAAILEREEFRRSFHRSEEAGTRLVAERDASRDDADTLRARVADLEGQLESVADRAAAAETALEAAPAAIYFRLLGKDDVPLLGDEYEDDQGYWHRVEEANIASVCILRPTLRRRVPAPAVVDSFIPAWVSLGRGIDATLAGTPSYAPMAVDGFPVLPVPDMGQSEAAPAASDAVVAWEHDVPTPHGTGRGVVLIDPVEHPELWEEITGMPVSNARPLVYQSAPAAIYFRLLGKDDLPLLGDEYEDDQGHWLRVEQANIASVCILRPTLRRRVPAPAASGNVEKKPMTMPSREWFERRVSVDDSEISVGGLANRVAELESSAPAASGAGLTPHVWGVVRALIDAADAVWDWCGVPLVQDEDRYGSAVRDLVKAIAAAESLLVNPLPSVPASDAAGTDVAEIARRAFDAGFGASREGFNAECAHDHLAPKESMFEGAGGEPYEKLKRDSLAKIMSEATSNAAGKSVGSELAGRLQRFNDRVEVGKIEMPQGPPKAVQPAPGWLTPEERSLLSSLADGTERRATDIDYMTKSGMTLGSGLPKASDCRADAAMLRSLIARSPDAKPRGWLTPEEREAIMYLIANRSQFAPQTPHEERRNAASRVCHALLARSSPPEVVLSTHGTSARPISGKPLPPLA